MVRVNASTHAALPLAYSLLSSLVVVGRGTETSRGGRGHRVWRGGLVRPGAIRSAVRRRRCSTAWLVPRPTSRRQKERQRATEMAQTLTVPLEPSFVPFGFFCMTAVADLESLMMSAGRSRGGGAMVQRSGRGALGRKIWDGGVWFI